MRALLLALLLFAAPAWGQSQQPLENAGGTACNIHRDGICAATLIEVGDYVMLDVPIDCQTTSWTTDFSAIGDIQAQVVLQLRLTAGVITAWGGNWTNPNNPLSVMEAAAAGIVNVPHRRLRAELTQRNITPPQGAWIVVECNPAGILR